MDTQNRETDRSNFLLSRASDTPSPLSVSPIFFFQGVSFKKLLVLALGLGGLSALILMFSELNINKGSPFSLYDFLQIFSSYSSCSFMALIFAEKNSLEYFLFKRKKNWSGKVRDLAVNGGLAGMMIGLCYHRLFTVYRFSHHVPLRVRQIKTLYDSFLLSVSAAFTEELVFRFLFFSSFLYILDRLFKPIMNLQSGLNRWIPVVFSVVFSCLMFGVVHGTYGFLFAFLAGILLCLIFLRGGLESAILAHFLADFVFFSLTCLFP